MELFTKWHRYKGDDYHFRRWRNGGWDYLAIGEKGDLKGWKFYERELNYEKLSKQWDTIKDKLDTEIEQFQKRQPIFYGKEKD